MSKMRIEMSVCRGRIFYKHDYFELPSLTELALHHTIPNVSGLFGKQPGTHFQGWRAGQSHYPASPLQLGTV